MEEKTEMWSGEERKKHLQKSRHGKTKCLIKERAHIQPIKT